MRLPPGLLDALPAIGHTMPMSQPAILLALRKATGAAHARLEGNLNFYARVAEPAARRGLVARFLEFHGGVESRIGPWLKDIPDLDFERRSRAPLILKDLEALGGTAPAVRFAVPIRSLGAALGWMYVLEGNSLGGRTIYRTLAGRGETLRGLAFLDPYGAETGDRWRSFIAILDRLHTEGRATVADVIEGAVGGFDHAHQILCLAPADVAQARWLGRALRGE